MKKGITPVIAMILLILIVVALGGVFATWSMTSVEDLQNSTSGHISEMSARLRRSITIDNIDTTNEMVYARNIGTEDLDLEQLTVYVDDVFCGSGGSWTILSGDPMLEKNELASIDCSATSGIAAGQEVELRIGSGDDTESVSTETAP